MSSEAVFFVLLAAVAVNLVVMAALIVAPVVDRRRASRRGGARDRTVDQAQREVPVPRYRLAEPSTPASRPASPARQVTRVESPVPRDSPAGAVSGPAGGPGMTARIAPTRAPSARGTIPPVEPRVAPATDEPRSPDAIESAPLSATDSASPPQAAETPEVLMDPDPPETSAEGPAGLAATPSVDPAAVDSSSAGPDPVDAAPVEPPPPSPGPRPRRTASQPPNGPPPRAERAGRKFRIPAHDDPRTSRSIHSFLNRQDGGADGPAAPAAPLPRASRDGGRGKARGDRGAADIDAIWPVDPLTGLGNRVAWDALVATEEDWLGPGDSAAVVVLQVDVIARESAQQERPVAGKDGPRPGEAAGAGVDGPERRAGGSAAVRGPNQRRAGAAGAPGAASAPGAPNAAGPAAWMPALAGALRLELRSSDRLARLGPGLVAGLLAGTTGEQALVVVERLRAAVESSLAARRAPLRFTTGVADVHACGGIDAALEAALDAAHLDAARSAPRSVAD